MAEKSDMFLTADDQRDFALVVEGSKVYVSRDYLAYWSPVLRKIFYPDGASFEQPEEGMLMKEKKLDEFLQFLHAVFPTPKALKVSEWNVATLLAYADEYQVAVLVERCVEFVSGQLQQGEPAGESLIAYLRLASVYSLKDLQMRLIPFVAQLSFDQIKAAHAELPSDVLSAVYQSKAMALARQAAVYRQPTLPKNAFKCRGCNNKTCQISSSGRSSCCGRSVHLLNASLEEIDFDQCSITCCLCDKDCSSFGRCTNRAYVRSGCCDQSMLVLPKNGRDAEAATAAKSAAADFSADLIDRKQ